MADRRTISTTRACKPAQRLPGFQSQPCRKNDYLTLRFVTRQFFLEHTNHCPLESWLKLSFIQIKRIKFRSKS